jgi:SNF2 family DNA or RNA helicase
MITIDLIEDTLREDFSGRALEQGRALFLEGAVMKIRITKNDLEASVRDGKHMHVVDFERIEDWEYIFFEGYCTCGEECCKHQVAALHAAVEKIEVSKGRKNTKKIPQAKLEGKNAGVYRRLPIEGGLAYAIRRHSPGRFDRLSWGESFEGTFISPNEMEFISVNTGFYYETRNRKIRLKVENGEVYVRCLSCSSTKQTLCSHQSALLDATAGVFSDIDLTELEEQYHAIMQDASQKLNIELAVVEKYYQLKVLPHGPTLVAKHQNMVGEQWLDITKGIHKNYQYNRQERIKATTARLEEGRAQRYAFFWTNEDPNEGFSALGILFAKGGAYKTKEGVKDITKLLDRIPNGFPPHIQPLGQQLFFYCQEEDPETQFGNVKLLIEEHMEALNEIYHYTYQGTIDAYRLPKVSALNLVKFVPGQLECKISFEVIDGFTHLSRHITYNGKAFDYKKVIYANPVFCSTKKEAYLYPHHRFQEFMAIFPAGYDTVILPAMDKAEKTSLVNQFSSHFELSVPSGFTMEEEILADVQLQILLREAGTFVLFEPRIKHGTYSFNAFEENAYYTSDKLYRVDEEDRLFLVNFLKEAHPKFDNTFQVQDYVYLDLNEMMNNYWFIHFNEACEAAGIEVLGQKELTKFNYSKHRADTYMHIKSGIDWFGVDAGVSFGNEKVKTADWIRALRNKETFVKLKDGSLGMLPEEWLKQASKVLAIADVEKGKLKISKYRFNIIEELFDNIDDKKIVKELEEKKARLQELDTQKKYPLPKNVNANFRDYQKHGFAWLKFLDESGFGGILADDMGLGKTLQVIALLADQISEPTSLVVVPRSLLFNWAAELDKFCPDLTYVIHHGPGRSKNMESLTANNLIITTYHTATNDVQLFKDFRFNYIILDESQAIKNPGSKRYKAMRLLQSRNKLAMTGTPIENNTLDLYAQLSFTSPGLLGGLTSFKNNFSIPIDSKGDTEAADLLRKLIHPFILRRTKEQVAKDLPEKTETIIYCEMETAQRKLYENLKTKIREDLEEAIEQKGVSQSKFQILDGLLRLRQMCNSPLLINPAFSGANANSVKINTLMDNLREALSQKHRALVFSQFVSLLKVLRDELDKRGIKYAYLDGSTTKRQAEVDKFMNDNEISIFLISIKAGNTGMNLTKADYVYIIDPWWNPAVEAQAIDRTHRIGQENHIFAYKLICKNSIEEKILKLQAKKKKLAADIIQTDENVMKSLDKEELMALFD